MSRNRGGDTFAAVSVEITGRSRVKKISRRGLERSARRILEILGQGRAELSLAQVENRERQTAKTSLINPLHPELGVSL